MRRWLPALLLLVAACNGPSAPLVASDIEVTRPVPGSGMSAGYVVLTNNTDAAMHIDRITSPEYGAVEVHETTLENGIARMRELPELVVPAHGSVTLQRGGKHLMLMQPRAHAAAVTLTFYSGETPLLTITQPFEAG